MLNKELALKEVVYWLSHLSTSARLGGKIHFFDLNIVAEDFYADLLNIIYGWDLINLNHSDLNAVAIDLGDTKRKIAVQVTSNRTKYKIQKTLDKFEEYKLSTHFNQLKLVIIGERTGNYPSLNVPASLVFDGKNDVLDDSEIIKAIRGLSTLEVLEVLDLLKRDIVPKKDVEAALQHDDKRVLEIYRDYFDRPALKDMWMAEGDYSGFQKALTDLIALMNTGILNNQSITKSMFQIQDSTIRSALAPVAEQLRCLRQLFNCHVRNSDINLENNSSNFIVRSKADVFDRLRESIIEELNLVLKSKSIAQISKA